MIYPRLWEFNSYKLKSLSCYQSWHVTAHLRWPAPLIANDSRWVCILVWRKRVFCCLSIHSNTTFVVDFGYTSLFLSVDLNMKNLKRSSGLGWLYKWCMLYENDMCFMDWITERCIKWSGEGVNPKSPIPKFGEFNTRLAVILFMKCMSNLWSVCYFYDLSKAMRI